MQLSRAHVRAVLRLPTVNWRNVDPQKAEQVATRCEALLQQSQEATSVARTQHSQRWLRRYVRALHVVLADLGVPAPIDVSHRSQSIYRGGR